MNDDLRLIEATLQGQTSAFGQLVQKYQDRLFTSLVYALGNAEDAKDVLQEAWVQALLHLESFHQSSSFYTWLYRIAFNVAASWRRKKKVDRLSLDQMREVNALEPIDPAADPETPLHREDCCRQVQEALQQLPEEYRTILVLREIEGHCYETIAEILNLPIGTVRSRLHRARAQLCQLLKQRIALHESL
ncbi:MAG: sigma-70 family RNA polymerase sigma factor [Thermoguttaceae bacterium]|nr:sigma-70 family RNA polymerase sigma factor [Thermoguttaceae bacterium]MDW8038177.1 sigma-70 family RNA polymerase sigma factor [Thermoguttaceae bacterium]